jgi:hypothetical protein
MEVWAGQAGAIWISDAAAGHPGVAFGFSLPLRYNELILMLPFEREA